MQSNVKPFVRKMCALMGAMFVMLIMVTSVQFATEVKIVQASQKELLNKKQEMTNPDPMKVLGEPKAKREEKYTVVVDAGHGGEKPEHFGAISVHGRKEKDFTLALALKIGHLLRQEDKINVVMTREDDSYIGLRERAAIANNVNADLFLSIHGNSAGPNEKDRSVVNGAETYYSHDRSKTFADTVHKYLLIGTQFKDLGVKKADFVVIQKTNMPSILLEVGFLSGLHDEPQLFDEQFQWRVAGNIVNGIKEYLGLF